MRTQSPDTSPEAERILIERIRQAPVSRRFRLVQSLSQRMLVHQDVGPEMLTQAIHTITVGYGLRIGQRVRAALTAQPGWQEQPVDLSTTLLPVMQALSEVGISSYLGGSIASSIHRMQQSASDIDLVLLPQGHETLPVGTALTSLQNEYLVEPEVIAQGLREGTSCSLIHVGTLMKIDLIFPHTPGVDEAWSMCRFEIRPARSLPTLASRQQTYNGRHYLPLLLAPGKLSLSLACSTVHTSNSTACSGPLSRGLDLILT